MPTALDISRRLIEQQIVPILRQHHPEIVDRTAVGIHGTGSDVLGLDDEISRDHHWGPRAVILLQDADADAIESVSETVARGCPREFEGHPVHHDRANRTAVCVDHISSYLKWFLGTSNLPQREEDWFGLCETDLLHVTGGVVVHDPDGVWTGVRKQLAYYPDAVWKKRVADWCMYVTGRDAPYNLHRVSQRGDEVASHIYFGQAIRRAMELGFAIERRYAPYPKWQYRLFKTLRGCGPKVFALLDQLVASEDSAPSSRSRVDLLIEINRIYATRLHELGLTGPPAFQPFHEGLTDLTLYASAREIYGQLPPTWREISFNQIESWEKLARLVLFDSGDYVKKKFG